MNNFNLLPKKYILKNNLIKIFISYFIIFLLNLIIIIFLYFLLESFNKKIKLQNYNILKLSRLKKQEINYPLIKEIENHKNHIQKTENILKNFLKLNFDFLKNLKSDNLQIKNLEYNKNFIIINAKIKDFSNYSKQLNQNYKFEILKFFSENDFIEFSLKVYLYE